MLEAARSAVSQSAVSFLRWGRFSQMIWLRAKQNMPWGCGMSTWWDSSTQALLLVNGWDLKFTPSLGKQTKLLDELTHPSLSYTLYLGWLQKRGIIIVTETVGSPSIAISSNSPSMWEKEPHLLAQQIFPGPSSCSRSGRTEWPPRTCQTWKAFPTKDWGLCQQHSALYAWRPTRWNLWPTSVAEGTLRRGWSRMHWWWPEAERRTVSGAQGSPAKKKSYVNCMCDWLCPMSLQAGICT